VNIAVVDPGAGVPKVFRRAAKMRLLRDRCFRKIEIGTGGKEGGPIYNKSHYLRVVLMLVL
jgi:hypothetical protein